MTDDLPQPTIQEKFDTALDVLADLCFDAGMHPIEMAEPLKRKLEWAQKGGER